MSERGVVMVDDNPGDHYLVHRALKRSGLSMAWRTFSRGEDFLTYFQRVSAGDEPVPRLILMDINMPGMSGLDVVARIRAAAELPTDPLIYVLSSSHDPRDAELAISRGASRYIEKPTTTKGFDDLFRELA